MTEENKKKQPEINLENFLRTSKEIIVPEVVYHYCSLDSFTKIIESGKLFLSHHSAMNDLSDTRLFFHLLYQKAQTIVNQSNREILNDFLHFFEQNLRDYFIACFSKEPDVLSQWNMYGDQGRGVAIGFYTKNLYVKPQIPSYTIDSKTLSGIFPIEYISETQDDLVDDLINLVLKGFFNDFPPNVERLVLQKKHRSFNQEEEIRIVEIQDPRTNLNPDFVGLRTRYVGDHFNFRIKNNRELIPYRTHQFKSNEDPNYELESIWLGPENRTKENILYLFLNKHRISLKNKIHYSKSPFTL
ncbi:Protein of unknown function (DUF2971) [Leptospira meyeri]|uniref:DUF2971 domain-containing protein n=1 Tax=Leptospira meyeri TaxID=29508 RepID=A0A4R8MP52_LEPME|nr:DUF2971 domain-containing protein [Leptospira meyeri]EKJ87024.1 PF11185 family protein [Leptospira meyeri serovar Hardjo str. Went 5]TDY66128.1 Protein of unknown function (DUF2971) [Leptospira meyeri]